MAERQWEDITSTEQPADPDTQLVWEDITASRDSDFSTTEYLMQRFMNPTASAGAGAAQPGSLTGFLPLGGRALETQAEMPSVTGADIYKLTTGREPQQARDSITQMVGGGVEALGDPLTYLFPGMTLPTKMGVGGLTGTGAEFGGIIGEQVAGTPGQIVGALGTGMALGTKAPAIGLGLKAAGSGVAQTYNKFKAVRADPEAAESAFAAGNIQTFLEKAAANQGGADNFNDVMDAFNEASQFVRGADTPLLISMAENPTVRSAVENLIKTDRTGDVRAQFNKELDTVAAAIEAKADKIFGARYKPFDEGTQGMHPSVIKQMESDRAASEALQKAIDKLVDPFAQVSSKTDLGVQIQRLVEGNMARVRAEMKPQYAGLMAQAKRAGAVLPETGVRDIYNFVRNNQLTDIFGVGTKVDNLIVKNFAPRDGEFFPVPFSAVESLKKRINELQRGSLSPTEARKLKQLEEVVDQARTQIKGNFSQRLAALDMEYYTRIGIPLSAEGIKDINSAKYAAQVAPIILKNKESLTDFLNVGGSQGMVIAENAMISKAFDKVIKTEGVSPKAIEAFMRQNREVLDQLPNAKKFLTEAMLDSQSLIKRKHEIDLRAQDAEKRIADNYLLTSGIPDYNILTRNFFANSKLRSKILADFKDVSPETARIARSNMQRELVEMLRNQGGSGVDFLLNPQNKEALDALLGKDAQESMLKIMRLSDNLAKADISGIRPELGKENMDAIGRMTSGGLNLPYIFSQLRDRISSFAQKVVRIGSRWNQARAEQKFDEALIKTLLHPEAHAAIKKMKGLDLSYQNPVKLKEVVDTFSASLPASVYFSTIGMDENEAQ